MLEKIAADWRRLIQAADTAASYGYAVVFALTLYEVFARYVLRQPTSWTMEICVLLAGIHYLISGASTQATGQHIRVDALTQMLPPAVRQVLGVLELVVIAVVCSALCWWAFQQAQVAVVGLERSGTQLNWPLPAILKAFVAIVLATIACSAILRLVTKRGGNVA